MSRKNFEDQYFNFVSRENGENRVNGYFVDILDSIKDTDYEQDAYIQYRKFIDKIENTPITYTIYDAFIEDLQQNKLLENKFIDYYRKEIDTDIYDWYDVKTKEIDFDNLLKTLINRYSYSIPQKEFELLFEKSWNNQEGYHEGFLIEPNIGFYDAFRNDLEYILDDLDYSQEDKKHFLNKYIETINNECERIINSIRKEQKPNLLFIHPYDNDRGIY